MEAPAASFASGATRSGHVPSCSARSLAATGGSVAPPSRSSPHLRRRGALVPRRAAAKPAPLAVAPFLACSSQARPTGCRRLPPVASSLAAAAAFHLWHRFHLWRPFHPWHRFHLWRRFHVWRRFHPYLALLPPILAGLDGRLVFAPDTEMMEDFIRSGVQQMEREREMNSRSGLPRGSNNTAEGDDDDEQPLPPQQPPQGPPAPPPPPPPPGPAEDSGDASAEPEAPAQGAEAAAADGRGDEPAGAEAGA
mmetsp:Transcript_15132/g.40653  ORF Transcript_15132/g.40653 Transcript_15132/m.40653 type:complete len:251 (-) Transcript_15132:267-1019(-)